ncbi:MFS transporter [Chloroflexi bacterium TSY]|nr:MFS transporter [Chloroflexi bacterium TSY]
MFVVLRQRNFTLLWLGQLLSTTGDTMLLLALPLYIYEQTGSALETGTMTIVQYLPRILLGSVAGVLADRWDRRRIMMVSDLLRAALLLLLLTGELWMIYVIAFVEATISQFFTPAKDALLPNLVHKRDLVAANSLNATSRAFMWLAGPTLGGALMALLGLPIVVLIDVASYLLSALLIRFIQNSVMRKESVIQNVESGWESVLQQLQAGFAVVREQHWLQALFIVVGLSMFGQGIINVLFVIFVREIVDVGAWELGWIVAAQGVGSLIGSFIMGRVGNSLQPFRMIVLARMGITLAFLVTWNFPLLSVQLVFSALLGIPAIANGVSTETLLQSRVENRYRGRVFGAMEMNRSLLQLGGSVLGTLLGDSLGVVNLLNISAGFCFLAGIVAWILFNKQEMDE